MTETNNKLPIKEKKVFKMEVEYTFTPDKDSDSQTSWFYHWAETDTLKRAETATKKHFTEMVTSTDWIAKVKLISIHEMKNSKSTPEHQVVSSEVLPPARTKNTTTTSTKRKTTTTRKPRTPRKPKT